MAEINKDYVLVIDRESNVLVKKEIPIVNDYIDFENRYKEKVEDDNISFADFLNHLEEEPLWDSKLKLGYRNIKYHSVLDIAFDGTPTFRRENLSDLLNTRSDSIFSDENSKWNKKRFFWEIKSRILAVNIEKIYNESDVLIKNGKRILYSHRRSGWYFPVYEFNDNFHAAIETNFGYGNSSFFYSILKYKGLTIVPYTKLVDYPYANAYHLCRFTEQYSLQAKEWEKAIDFCLTAFNLALSDEMKFIQKYVVDEALEMVNRLEYFSTGNEFQFIRYDGSYFKEVYTGAKLIAFRVEKLASSLDFFESIRKFEGVLQLDLSSNKIIELNRRIYRNLENEIELYTNQLQVIKSQLEEEEEKFFEASEIRDREKFYIDKFSTDFSDRFSADLYSLLFELKFSERLEEINTDYEKKYKIYSDIKDKFNYLEGNIEKIKECQLKIEKYFKENSLELVIA